MQLSPEQKALYWQDGCLLLPGLFPPALLQRFEARFLLGYFRHFAWGSGYFGLF